MSITNPCYSMLPTWSFCECVILKKKKNFFGQSRNCSSYKHCINDFFFSSFFPFHFTKFSFNLVTHATVPVNTVKMIYFLLLFFPFYQISTCKTFKQTMFGCSDIPEQNCRLLKTHKMYFIRHAIL